MAIRWISTSVSEVDWNRQPRRFSSWRKVSARYKDDPNARALLIEEVKNGSSGKWSDITNGAVMPPNSPRVSDQDIGELVDFILSLAKDKALR